MFQPKRHQHLVPLNRTMRAVILVFSAVIAATTTLGTASAETPTPTPSVTSMPTPTAIGDPDGFNIPTPEPTTPVVCGVGCFNPTLNSIDQASSPWVVVNKLRPLAPITYKPKLDKTINLAVPAAAAYRKLKTAVAAFGYGTLCLNSGYRSYATQTYTYNNALARYGKKVAEALAAHPGHSEHQTGLAADVSTTALGCKITNFGSSKASAWIAKNAYQFGFIVRYPNNMQKITGYQYEPWHLRFVGVELATQMQKNKISTLEQFWQLPSAPNYKN